MMKILTEASGSLTSAYLIKSIQKAGHQAVASDITRDCFGRYLANDFILMPKANDSNLWGEVEELLIKHKIDVVIPSFDEMLIGWAERKEYFRQKGVTVICSEANTIRNFQDKWLTYQFFLKHGIPTPETSLKQKFSLVKPRFGRGGKGIRITRSVVSMEGSVSQEIVDGQEYTVDVLCGSDSQPIYIVPRIRQGVVDGKSTGGIVVYKPEIIDWVERICRNTPFKGPINIQCFLGNDDINFIEINPRIAGGMALGFAATENWIPLLIDNFVYNKAITNVKPIQYGMMMRRYYAEVFIPPSELGSG